MLVAKGIRYLKHKAIMKIMNVTWWSGKAKIQRPKQQKVPFTTHNFEGDKFKPNIKHLIHVSVCALVKKMDRRSPSSSFRMYTRIMKLISLK